MTPLEKLRSLAKSLNSPQSKRRDTMAGVLYEARREVVGILAEMEKLRAEVVAECMNVVGEMRQSEAGLFDAKHSGQRGCDRADALYDAYVAIRALLEPPALAVKTDGDRNE